MELGVYAGRIQEKRILRHADVHRIPFFRMHFGIINRSGDSLS